MLLLLLAPDAIDPGKDFGGFAKRAFDAIHSSNWRLLAALALIGIIWALRTYLSKLLPKLSSDRAGALLAVCTGISGAVSNALMAGQPVTLSVLMDGLGLGITAAGGWSVAKRIIAPPDKQEEAAANEATPKA